MPRAPFAIMIAMTTFLALPALPSWAQDAASDATTPMDKQVGNQQPPTDDTLSNQEVQSLEKAGGQPRRTAAPVATDPAVSGTTAIYKEKGGSAAQSEEQE